LDTDYLFYGDSFAATLLPENPASISQTFYANDTYIMSDTTESGANRLQDGTRVWTVLNIVAAPGVSGVYKLVFQSSEYDFDGSSGAIGLTAADLSGGIITIENSTVIPEPATFSMGLAGLVGLVWRARQKGK
jgi:hypothetical protein